MPEHATITQIGDQHAPIQPEQPQENGKNQLSGESSLWYHRYCLYRDLGHKRSLRAAVVKERETLRVVNEPEAAPKSPKIKKEVGKKQTKADILPAVPVINVPGSWKNACKVYRWQERAKAFDHWLVKRAGDFILDTLGDSYANPFKRVLILDSLLKSVIINMEDGLKEKNGMPRSMYLAYIKQAQSLMKQLQTETTGIDSDLMRTYIEAWGRSQLDDLEKSYHSGANRIEVKRY